VERAKIDWKQTVEKSLSVVMIGKGGGEKGKGGGDAKKIRWGELKNLEIAKSWLWDAGGEHSLETGKKDRNVVLLKPPSGPGKNNLW